MNLKGRSWKINKSLQLESIEQVSWACLSRTFIYEPIRKKPCHLLDENRVGHELGLQFPNPLSEFSSALQVSLQAWRHSYRRWYLSVFLEVNCPGRRCYLGTYFARLNHLQHVSLGVIGVFETYLVWDICGIHSSTSDLRQYQVFRLKLNR